MKNKTPLLLLGLLGILLLAAFSAPDLPADSPLATQTSIGDPERPSEFIKRDANGDIILHGYYERNAQGTCTRYTVYDSAGELFYTMIPYATQDGRYLRVDKFDASGQLENVAVMIGEKTITLSPEGTVIDIQLNGDPAYSALLFLTPSDQSSE